MADLPTNLKDDILDSSVNTRRKYRMIENEDGTYSFEDLTEYNQVGDEYGAGLINETNRQVNARVEKAVVVRDLETIGAITQEGFIPDALALKDVNESLEEQPQFVYDENGQITGYTTKIGGADTVFPFSNGGIQLVSMGIQKKSSSSWVEFDLGVNVKDYSSVTVVGSKNSFRISSDYTSGDILGQNESGTADISDYEIIHLHMAIGQSASTTNYNLGYDEIVFNK